MYLFRSYLPANVSSWVLVANSGSEEFHSNFFSVTCAPEKLLILSLVFLGVGNFDARYFFGSKISGLCIFLGLQYEAPSDPPEYPPPPPPPPGICIRLMLFSGSLML